MNHSLFRAGYRLLSLVGHGVYGEEVFRIALEEMDEAYEE